MSFAVLVVRAAAAAAVAAAAAAADEEEEGRLAASWASYSNDDLIMRSVGAGGLNGSNGWPSTQAGGALVV